ncbi:MAG: hypothetical protein OER43_14435 [Gammaproteobacteria bacterium]|nr:hypothetical protein [Gammaproteobacteria bacterium]
MNADDTSKYGEDALSEQRVLLDQLVTWEHELEVLKELESDLEVEQISADVALKRATSKHKFAVSPADAEEIARARARKRELETALQSGRGDKSPSIADLRAELDHMRAGREALEAWRDAPETVSAWRRPRVANTVLMVACAAAVWAAVAVHPIYLVLLVPLVMAIGYFTFTGQDADWLRLGAVRRFQNTGLKPPSSWERIPVDGRIAELNDAAANVEQRLSEIEASEGEASEHEDDAASELSLSMELVSASDAYAAALTNAGLDVDNVEGDLSKWFDLFFENYRISSELNQVKAKRTSLSRQAEDARDAVFRFLALADEAPPEGRADVGALRAGLDRLAKRAT